MLSAVLVLTGAAVSAVTFWPIGRQTEPIMIIGDASRGAYLARMAGCITCHTDGENGGAPLAGGVRLKTGFGTFVTPNLTTDRQEGIGAWTLETFDRAVRQGISPSGAPYYPAFPYAFYGRFSDRDIADLWAAFQTVPPVGLDAGAHDIRFPFNIRAGLKLWRAAFIDLAPFNPDPARSEIWNRENTSLKGPRIAVPVIRRAMPLAPGRRTTGYKVRIRCRATARAPAITPSSLKDRGWTVSDLSYALKTGLLPDGDAFGGAMGEVVNQGTAFLTDSDRKAIATYLLETQ
ncbi:MAG: cytochrome C [Zhengella sp.]|uniref:cytochrome C n=1 Tax=Zhengella sp. TaxID=2282762 RepID=UPI003528E9B9